MTTATAAVMFRPLIAAPVAQHDREQRQAASAAESRKAGRKRA